MPEIGKKIYFKTFNAVEFVPPAVPGYVVWCDLLIKG